MRDEGPQYRGKASSTSLFSEEIKMHYEQRQFWLFFAM
jgi:hypothetical protein